jgi:hypothetical protein
MKKRYLEEDPRKIYGSPAWGSLDIFSARMVIKEFMLYKNEVLLDMLDYVP